MFCFDHNHLSVFCLIIWASISSTKYKLGNNDISDGLILFFVDDSVGFLLLTKKTHEFIGVMCLILLGMSEFDTAHPLLSLLEFPHEQYTKSAYKC